MRLKVVITLYLLGTAFFLLFADFHSPSWVKVWGFWQRLCFTGVFGWWLLLYYVSRKERFIVSIPLWYSVALLLWELTSLLTGWSINNTTAVRLIFGITAAAMCILAIFSDSRLISRYKHV